MKRVFCSLCCVLNIWASVAQESILTGTITITNTNNSTSTIDTNNEAIENNKDTNHNVNNNITNSNSANTVEHIINNVTDYADHTEYLQFRDIIIGQVNAKQSLVIYPFFSCSNCLNLRSEQFKNFKAQYIDTGKIKVIIRNYLDDEQVLNSTGLPKTCCEHYRCQISCIINSISEQIALNQQVILNNAESLVWWFKVSHKLMNLSTVELYLTLFDVQQEWVEEYVQSKRKGSSFAQKLKEVVLPDYLKLDDIVVGSDDAQYNIAIYSSFTCNHCYKFHNEEFHRFKKLYIDTGKIKVVFRNYLDDMGALESAILLRACCAHYQKNLTAILKDVSINELINQKSTSENKTKDTKTLELTKKLIEHNKFMTADLNKLRMNDVKSESNEIIEQKKQKFIKILVSLEALRLYAVLFTVQKDWLKSEKPRNFLVNVFVKHGYAEELVRSFLNTNNPEYKRITAGLMKEQQRAMNEFLISSVPAFVFNLEKYGTEERFKVDSWIHQGFITAEGVYSKCEEISNNKQSKYRNLDTQRFQVSSLMQQLDPNVQYKLKDIK